MRRKILNPAARQNGMLNTAVVVIKNESAHMPHRIGTHGSVPSER
jgi:hypothetical protein